MQAQRVESTYLSSFGFDRTMGLAVRPRILGLEVKPNSALWW